MVLVRAVYQDKDIYFIEDVFSAVDSNVAAFLFRKCIVGLLKDKTEKVCTHHNEETQSYLTDWVKTEVSFYPISV